MSNHGLICDWSLEMNQSIFLLTLAYISECETTRELRKMTNMPYRKFESENSAEPKLTIRKKRFLDHLVGYCPVCQEEVSNILILKTFELECL